MQFAGAERGEQGKEMVGALDGLIGPKYTVIGVRAVYNPETQVFAIETEFPGRSVVLESHRFVRRNASRRECARGSNTYHPSTGRP